MIRNRKIIKLLSEFEITVYSEKAQYKNKMTVLVHPDYAKEVSEMLEGIGKPKQKMSEGMDEEMVDESFLIRNSYRLQSINKKGEKVYVKGDIKLLVGSNKKIIKLLE